MRLVVSGWNEGMNKVQLNRALRDHAGYGLSEAKNAVDQLLDGKTIVIEAEGGDSATSLCQELSLTGAICRLED